MVYSVLEMLLYKKRNVIIFSDYKAVKDHAFDVII